MNKFQAAILAALVAPSFAAQAATADWYILNGQTTQCVSATAPDEELYMHSPSLLEAWLRNKGMFRVTKVMRDNDRRIIEVFVSDIHRVGIYYYPTKESCMWAREWNFKQGLMTDPEELK